MKYVVASDIHGSAKWTKELIAAYGREDADRLILLGDLLNHGPRNPFPDEYDPQQVADLLNGYKQDIIAVRGNCDSEVDQMLFEFPMMSDSALLALGERLVFLTHGHLFDRDNPPQLNDGDILICGHFHIDAAEDVSFKDREGKFLYCNPGSISLPKGDSDRGYMVLEPGKISWKRMDGAEFRSVPL